MGMEIKVIFKKHGNAVICMLEGRLALVGQLLKMLCLLWGPLCRIQLSLHLTRSLQKVMWKIAFCVPVTWSPFISFLGKISIIQF